MKKGGSPREEKGTAAEDDRPKGGGEGLSHLVGHGPYLERQPLGGGVRLPPKRGSREEEGPIATVSGEQSPYLRSGNLWEEE